MCSFQTLKFTPNRRTPANQVRVLIDNIHISTTDFAVIKGHVRTNFRTDLHGAIEYISQQITKLFPTAHDSNRRYPQHRFISNVDSSGSNCPQNFEGLEQHNGVFTFYGVDVTNVFRRFTYQEMTMLGPVGQAYIYQEQSRDTGGRGRSRAARGRTGGWGRHNDTTGRSIAAASTNREVFPGQVTTKQATVTTYVTPATLQQDTRSSDLGSTNGNRFGPGAYGF